MGDRFLALFICPKEDGNLILRFSEYDLITKNPSINTDFDITYDDIEGEWLWAYYGYN